MEHILCAAPHVEAEHTALHQLPACAAKAVGGQIVQAAFACQYESASQLLYSCSLIVKVLRHC
jgi:hypothetical protein